MKKYTLRPEILLLNIASLMVPLFFIYLVLNKISEDISVLKDFAFLAFCVVVIIVAIIYFGIPIGFLKEDIGKNVVIDLDKNILTISKDGKEIQFHFKDIIKCYYVKNSESILRRSIFYDFKYLVLILSNYDKIFITNLIVKPEVIIEEVRLKVETIETYLPFVDKNIGSGEYNKEEYDKKVKEYYSTFSAKSIDELELICKRSSLYSKYAIAAAKQLINEKTNA